MLRSRVAFAVLCSGCACAALPVLDLPSEMVMDVNTPPFPTVNVIADQPITASAQVDTFQDTRSAQRSLFDRVANAQQTFEASAGVRLEAQNQQLNNLRQMSARIGVLTRGAK